MPACRTLTPNLVDHDSLDNPAQAVASQVSHYAHDRHDAAGTRPAQRTDRAGRAAGVSAAARP